MRTYATFGLGRSLRQLGGALARRRNAAETARVLAGRFARDCQRIERHLRSPLREKRILEIGPGQDRLRACALAARNDVTALDLDVIPSDGGLREYWRMFRLNGASRLVKTTARRLLFERVETRAWRSALAAPELGKPHQVHGDICAGLPPGLGTFDAVVSWSVFEHLPDPEAALRNVVAALRPGGALYLGVHLYTCHTGHHDIRAFVGDSTALPAWGHLRPSTRDQITPSSYLNGWRLAQWRTLFATLPGEVVENLEAYSVRERWGPLLTPAVRAELADYADEELFTVDAFWSWRKPEAG